MFWNITFIPLSDDGVKEIKLLLGYGTKPITEKA